MLHTRHDKKRLSIPLVFWSFLLLVTLTLANTSLQAQAIPAGFVVPCGRLFCYNGRVFNVAGTNNHYLGWGTQAEVDQVLNDAKAMNLNVVRTILHSVRGSLDSTQLNQGTMPLKWNWASTADSSNLGMKGVYILYWDTATGKMAWNDSSVDGLGRFDYVIWKAKQLDIKLDVALLDFWQWAGGVQQINANYKGGNYNVSNAPDRYTFFFTDPRTKQFYKDWVEHVLNRTNALTGIKYKDDPTIFAWDLMNEPEIAGTALGQAWISEMSAHVKSIDRKHMVASGNEGFADGHAGSSPQLEMKISTIDFATWHTYPTYHGLSTTDVTNLINANCQIAATGNKPVLLQEFAYPSTKSDQLSVYQIWLDTIYNNPNCAGWLFWRLEGRQQSGQYPSDNGENFGVYNDNSQLARIFKTAAIRLITRNTGASATSTPRPNQPPIGTAPVNTSVPVSTLIPTIAPVSTVIPPNAPPPVISAGPFVKGINFNGNTVTIQGNRWLSHRDALAQGLTVVGALLDSKSVATSPVTDAATAAMLNTSLYASTDQGAISLSQTLPNGTYYFYVWSMENWGSNQHKWDLAAENQKMAGGLGDLAMHQWRRYGPYGVTVSDGILNLDLRSATGRAMIMGLEIYASGTSAPGNPSVPTQIPPSTTVPIATALPTNTPPVAALGTFVRGINFNGNAVTIQGNTWLSYSNALTQGLTVYGALLDSKSVTTSPATDSATTAMLNTSLYASADQGAIILNQTLPNGAYQFYIWSMENWGSNQHKWDLMAEGEKLAGGLGDLAMHQWRRYGPYKVTVTDGILNLDLRSATGRAVIMGLEIYTS
jgi:hypothetical protein